MCVFCILLIVGLLIWSACRPDRHNAQKDAEALEKIEPFEIAIEPMGGFTRFMNLAYSKDNNLVYFAYQDGWIKVQVENGDYITAPLNEIEVHFEKMNSTPLSIKVKWQKYKIKFYQTSNIAKNQMSAIVGVLVLCPKTYGKDYVSSFYKTTSALNSIIKGLSHFT